MEPSYDEKYAFLEKRVDALKTNKTGDERDTEGEVFDRKTLRTLYGMMTGKMLSAVHFPISTGKEGNVFYAEDYEGEPMALKIFRTNTATFKRLSKYVEGDPRFKNAGGNHVRMVYIWVGKEYSNLCRYADAGLPVPEPIGFENNCLLMEYIGDENGPAKQLKDYRMADPDDMYDEVVSFIIDGWRDAHLVHGDLSEYNILVQDDQPILIDVGQAMTNDFFNAKDLLIRDINNVNRFFKNKGADIYDLETILDETLNGSDDPNEEEEE